MLAATSALSQEQSNLNEAICKVSPEVSQHVNDLLDRACAFDSAPHNPTQEEVASYNGDVRAYYDAQIQCQGAIQEGIEYILDSDLISDDCRSTLKNSQNQVAGMISILTLQREHLEP